MHFCLFMKLPFIFPLSLSLSLVFLFLFLLFQAQSSTFNFSSFYFLVTMTNSFSIDFKKKLAGIYHSKISYCVLMTYTKVNKPGRRIDLYYFCSFLKFFPPRTPKNKASHIFLLDLFTGKFFFSIFLPSITVTRSQKE